MVDITRIEVTSDDFRRQLAAHINEVCYGNAEVIITRRGKPHAKLVAIAPAQSTREMARDELKKIQDQSDEDFLTRAETDRALEKF